MSRPSNDDGGQGKDNGVCSSSRGIGLPGKIVLGVGAAILASIGYGYYVGLEQGRKRGMREVASRTPQNDGREENIQPAPSLSVPSRNEEGIQQQTTRPAPSLPIIVSSPTPVESPTETIGTCAGQRRRNNKQRQRQQHAHITKRSHELTFYPRNLFPPQYASTWSVQIFHVSAASAPPA